MRPLVYYYIIFRRITPPPLHNFCLRGASSRMVLSSLPKLATLKDLFSYKVVYHTATPRQVCVRSKCVFANGALRGVPARKGRPQRSAGAGEYFPLLKMGKHTFYFRCKNLFFPFLRQYTPPCLTALFSL